MTPSPWDDLELWAGYVHGGFVFKGTKKAFNGFESQRAVSLSQTSSEVWSEKKGRGSWDQLQRCFWVLPVLAWRFHKGQFHSRWQRPAHYHLCPALWWERCLFQFGSGPLKEKRERERREFPRSCQNVSAKLTFKHFNSASTLRWCTWPNYGILIFLMCFN